MRRNSASSPERVVLRAHGVPECARNCPKKGEPVMRVTSVALFAVGVLLAAACSQSPKSPAAPDVQPDAMVAAAAVPLSEAPPFNLEAILRPVGDGGGFGHVKFRQPKDNLEWIYLDVWVRDLAPNATYLLQRAVDTELDGVCTGAGWLTLGKDNVTPGPIVTDASGTGTAALSRNVGAVAN